MMLKRYVIRLEKKKDYPQGKGTSSRAEKRDISQPQATRREEEEKIPLKRKTQIFFLLFSPLSLSLRHFLLLLLLLLLLDFFFSAVGAKKGTKRPQNKLERISEKERERDDELFPRESFRWWW